MVLCLSLLSSCSWCVVSALVPLCCGRRRIIQVTVFVNSIVGFQTIMLFGNQSIHPSIHPLAKWTNMWFNSRQQHKSDCELASLRTSIQFLTLKYWSRLHHTVKESKLTTLYYIVHYWLYNLWSVGLLFKKSHFISTDQCSYDWACRCRRRIFCCSRRSEVSRHCFPVCLLCLDYVWVKQNTNKGIIKIMKFIEPHYRFTGSFGGYFRGESLLSILYSTTF